MFAQPSMFRQIKGISANLLPAVKDKVEGMSYLTIRIDKIGFKDPQEYVDPFFRVSIRG